MNIRVDYLADHRHAVAIIARWLFEEWGQECVRQSVEAMEATLRRRLHRNRLPIALVALDKATPIGTVSLKIREVEIRPEYEHWLGALYVAKSYRCRGVGSLLVEAAKSKARRLGLRTLYLYTRETETRRLYERLRFVEVEELRYLGRPAVIMSFNLVSAQPNAPPGLRPAGE